MKGIKIIVSNGSHQFHLAPLASELSKRGLLAGLITSGWPTGFWKWSAQRFTRWPQVRRFLNREEQVPVAELFATNIAELIFQFSIRLRRISEQFSQHLAIPGFYWYALYAITVLRKRRAGLYHYRSCYGLVSVKFARRRGIPVLCDHSIAHPGVLDHMVANGGKWPDSPLRLAGISSPLLRLMCIDLQQADRVVVNSQFVKDTCIFSGIPAEKIDVVYLGVDDRFLSSIPAFDPGQVRSRASRPVLYVGGLQRRKGLGTLAEACLLMKPTPAVRLVGGQEHGIETLAAVKEWFAQPRVERVGIVERQLLAREMVAAPIFVFPSYCEGSARVVFEAMACGCYVITTPNAGSIVETGVHGEIVPPGDASALAIALARALANPEAVAEIGWRNACLVRTSYRQSAYADKVIGVYRQHLSGRPSQS